MPVAVEAVLASIYPSHAIRQALVDSTVRKRLAVDWNVAGKLYAGAESNFSMRALAGERPVQRLKA